MGVYTGNYTEMSQIFEELSKIRILGNDILNSTLLFFLIILASFIIAKIVYFFFEKIMFHFAKKTKTKIDDLILERTKKPFYLLVIFFGIRIALFPLVIPTAIENIFISITYSLIIITVFLIIAKIANIFIEEWGREFAKKTKSSVDDNLLSLFHRFINIFFIILTSIFVLNQWGFAVGPFVASLGVAGIVLGLALQSTIANIFGGIQLIIDQTFKKGDTIKAGNDILGVVKDIGIRSTRVITPDNELLIIPNGQLSNMVIQNFAQPEEKARVTVEFGVEYGSDAKKVKEVVEKALNKMPGILKTPEVSVVFMHMGDFSLLFNARFWVDTYTIRNEKKIEATNLIYETLQKNNIKIPFPTRTVYMKKDE